MPYKGTNLFAQIIGLIDRPMFARTVRTHRAEYGAKGFSCWEQLVAMLFCQLGRAHSLREISGGLASSGGRLSHLGLQEAPRRSTLAYANEHRTHHVFEETFYHLLKSSQGLDWGKRPFRFKNKLYSWDATFVELCLSMFDWARFRRTKGALKLHLLLDHDGYLPTYMHISDGKANDRRVTREQLVHDIALPEGSFLVFDAGYNDFGMFAHWQETGVFFVTRMHENAVYTITERRAVPEHSRIRADQIIRMTGPLTQQKCPYPLRRVKVWDAENKQMIVLLTNHLAFGATTIAEIYKERWQIEIFFKTIKQNLKIKTFVGTSVNAVKIQLWTALITILLLKILKYRSSFAWSMSNLVAMLRFNLFSYRDLMTWLNHPYRAPSPAEDSLGQLELLLT
jgi:hypothetical protein